MTREDEFIGQLEAYLDEYEGMTPLPSSIRDAVRAELPTTRQIGPVTGLMRDTYMNSSMDSPARWGLVVAVVIGAVIIGGALFFGDGVNVGGPSASTPSPSVAPSEAPSEAAVPSPGEPEDFGAHPGGSLDPGDYAFTHIEGIQVVFTVTAGWEKNPPDHVVWSIDDEKATMSARTIYNLYNDPCQPELGLQAPPVGPTANDLATALGSVPGLTFSAPTSVTTTDGVSGLRLHYVPPDDFRDCNGGDIQLAPEMLAPTGDRPVTIDIYDVDGTRVVIAANYTDARDVQLDQMLNSIRFD